MTTHVAQWIPSSKFHEFYVPIKQTALPSRVNVWHWLNVAASVVVAVVGYWILFACFTLDLFLQMKQFTSISWPSQPAGSVGVEMRCDAMCCCLLPRPAGLGHWFGMRSRSWQTSPHRGFGMASVDEFVGIAAKYILRCNQVIIGLTWWWQSRGNCR